MSEILYLFYPIYGYLAIPGFSILINGILMALAAIAVFAILFNITKTEE